MGAKTHCESSVLVVLKQDRLKRGLTVHPRSTDIVQLGVIQKEILTENHADVVHTVYQIVT